MFTKADWAVRTPDNHIIRDSKQFKKSIFEDPLLNGDRIVEAEDASGNDWIFTMNRTGLGVVNLDRHMHFPLFHEGKEILSSDINIKKYNVLRKAAAEFCNTKFGTISHCIYEVVLFMTYSVSSDTEYIYNGGWSIMKSGIFPTWEKVI